MASREVTIAKASLAASLLRADPLSISRPKIDEFHSLIDQAVLRCTHQNIEDSKEWIGNNVLASKARVVSLCKYLSALAMSHGKGLVVNEATAGAVNPSSKRRALHVLFLVNDLLHETKYHSSDKVAHGSLTAGLQTTLPSIVEAACSFPKDTNPKHFAKLADLLTLWESNAYLSQDLIFTLRSFLEDDPGNVAANRVSNGTHTHQEPSKRTPWTMPATHGDPSTPWYDLPAANILPHIVPNSLSPIDPNLVTPLKLTPGPADPKMVIEVEALLNGANDLYGETKASRDGKTASDDMPPDVDMMGQPLHMDEITGELIPTESYYGWSIAFCEQMKARKRDAKLNGANRGRNARTHREGSYSRSRNGSYSPSRSRSPSRGMYNGNRRLRDNSSNRSHSSSRSRSPSRSSSRPGLGGANAGPGSIDTQEGLAHAEGLSHGQTPSRRPPLPYSHSSGSGGIHPSRAHLLQAHTSMDEPRPHSRSGSTSLSHSRSPRHKPDPYPPNLVTPLDQIDAPFPWQHQPQPPPPPTAPPHVSNFPLGPSGLPVPPKPPFYDGPWPPPPPPVISEDGKGFVAPQLPPSRGPPPPPPPPPHQGAWQGQGPGRGRGQYGGYGSGPGQYGHGRGR